jgi:pilus assembly protein Flp/PilA
MIAEVLMRLMTPKMPAARASREQGATVVEYGLMVALVAVAGITAVGLLGTRISGMFDTATGKVR